MTEKSISGSKSGDDRPLKSEEVISLVINRGLTVADLDRMTYGMVVNYACAYDRQRLIAAGKKVIDPEIKYEELKANLPVVEERYKQGKSAKNDTKSILQKSRHGRVSNG